MLDHVIGRPSSKSRRLQVLAVISFWSFYLYKYDIDSSLDTLSLSSPPKMCVSVVVLY